MAKLTEIKRSAELTTRKLLDNSDFLIWTNEMLETLSEISKQEAEVLEVELRASDYYVDRDVNGTTEQLLVTKTSVQLPSDYMQIIKVEGDFSQRRILFYQRSFGDREITTQQNYANSFGLPYNNQYDLFFIDYSGDTETLNVKSNFLGKTTPVTLRVYYYKELPTYDVETDSVDMANLELPFDKNYHNLLTYYIIMKYYESWQDKESANYYRGEYLRIRNEYESSVLRRHQENETTQQLKESYWA